MNRRDFMLFRRGNREPIAEISCRDLHLHIVDSEIAFDRAAADAWEPWMGEPPLVRASSPDIDAVFADLERQLESVRILKLCDLDWAAREDIRSRLEQLVTRFTSRGGRLELASSHRSC